MEAVIAPHDNPLLGTAHLLHTYMIVHITGAFVMIVPSLSAGDTDDREEEAEEETGFLSGQENRDDRGDNGGDNRGDKRDGADSNRNVGDSFYPNPSTLNTSNNSNNSSSNINNSNNNNNNSNRSSNKNNKNKVSKSSKNSAVKSEKTRIREGHVSLFRAVVSLAACLFYVGLLANVIVRLCQVRGCMLSVYYVSSIIRVLCVVCCPCTVLCVCCVCVLCVVCCPCTVLCVCVVRVLCVVCVYLLSILPSQSSSPSFECPRFLSTREMSGQATPLCFSSHYRGTIQHERHILVNPRITDRIRRESELSGCLFVCSLRSLVSHTGRGPRTTKLDGFR